jgi:hypothetical protein
MVGDSTKYYQHKNWKFDIPPAQRVVLFALKMCVTQGRKIIFSARAVSHIAFPYLICTEGRQMWWNTVLSWILLRVLINHPPPYFIQATKFTKKTFVSRLSQRVCAFFTGGAADVIWTWTDPLHLMGLILFATQNPQMSVGNVLRWWHVYFYYLFERRSLYSFRCCYKLRVKCKTCTFFYVKILLSRGCRAEIIFAFVSTIQGNVDLF